jgi:hypothetical protein
LDWEFAGFYPRIFEKYSILCIGQKEDYQFAADLSKALDHLYEKAGVEANDERMIGFLNLLYRKHDQEKYYFRQLALIWVRNIGLLLYRSESADPCKKRHDSHVSQVADEYILNPDGTFDTAVALYFDLKGPIKQPLGYGDPNLRLWMAWSFRRPL